MATLQSNRNTLLGFMCSYCAFSELQYEYEAKEEYDTATIYEDRMDRIRGVISAITDGYNTMAGAILVKRCVAGKTKKTIAEEIGVSLSHVERLERGAIEWAEQFYDGFGYKIGAKK